MGAICTIAGEGNVYYSRPAARNEKELCGCSPSQETILNERHIPKKVPQKRLSDWPRYVGSSRWRPVRHCADFDHTSDDRCKPEIATVSHELFGSFLEQLGRAIYEGVYDPGSKLSNAQGFRNDVIEEVRELQVPIVRWPGGNFVSGYHWLDGVGPREKRPTVLDRAWNTLETNQFGTNEFLTWARLAGTEPLMGLNSEPVRPRMQPRWWNIAMGPTARSGAICAAPMATLSHGGLSSGVWAMRWMARGRLGTCLPRNMG